MNLFIAPKPRKQYTVRDRQLSPSSSEVLFWFSFQSRLLMFHAMLFWQGNSIFRKTFEFYLSVWPNLLENAKNSKLQNFLCPSALCPVGPRPGQKSAGRAGPWQNFTDCLTWMSRGTIGTGIENVRLSRPVSCQSLDAYPWM